MDPDAIENPPAEPPSPDPDEAGSSPADADSMLLEFVRDRDAECPKCGYNLRNLTRPICPECREALRLTVGLIKVQIGWLIVTLIPGAFSGICAFILMLPIIIVPMSGQAPAPPPIILLDAFGWLSGFTAIGLFLARYRFLGLARWRQMALAMLVWAIHVLAFLIVLAWSI